MVSCCTKETTNIALTFSTTVLCYLKHFKLNYNDNKKNLVMAPITNKQFYVKDLNQIAS